MATAHTTRGRVSKEQTDKRREWVARLWVEGYSQADIVRRIEQETGEPWTRQTIARDVAALQARWEKEGHKRSASNRKAELERMSRLVFQRAMARKRTATRRELDEDGKVVVTTVLVADPDLRSANKAVERLGALHGLNVTTLDGSMSVQGLADLFGDLDD
jgi:hypothetical protein